MAEHDRVGAAEHAEQRTTTAPVLRRSLDQTGYLDELHRDPQIDESAGTGRSVVNA